MITRLFANQWNDITLYHRTFVQERCRYNNSKTFARHTVTLKSENQNVLAKRKKVIRGSEQLCYKQHQA